MVEILHKVEVKMKINNIELINRNIKRLNIREALCVRRINWGLRINRKPLKNQAFYPVWWYNNSVKIM